MCLADGGARRRGWNKAWSGLAKVPPWLTAAVPMENPYCSCKLTELVGSRAKALDALVYTELIEPLAGVGTYIYIYMHGLSSDTMALIVSDCGAMRLPGHQMAAITSGFACDRRERGDGRAADEGHRRPARPLRERWPSQGHRCPPPLPNRLWRRRDEKEVVMCTLCFDHCVAAEESGGENVAVDVHYLCFGCCLVSPSGSTQ